MTTVIDFEGLTSGDVVTNQFQAEGVTISAIGGSGEAMIFDSSNPTGGDHDLATGNLGNVLIVSEDGDSGDPDDNAGGGTFAFAFETASVVKSLTFLDIEETAEIKLFDADGALIETICVGPTGNGGQCIAHIDVAGVANMEVTLQGSGAIDNLAFVASAGPDYIVEGTSGGDLIDVAYDGDPEGDRIDAGDNLAGNDDDSVRAGAGDDTVYAGDGDDTVEGGSGDDFILGDDAGGDQGDDLLLGEDGDDTLCGLGGDDTLDGGAGADLLEGMVGDDLILGGSGSDRAYGDSGNDTLYGDSGTQDDGSVREVFQWDLGPSNAADFTQDTGNVLVSFSEVNGGASDNIATNQQNVSGIDTGGAAADATSSLDSETGGQGKSDTYTLGFSDPVENVSFRVNDIDGDGIVTIKAFDENGDPIEVQLAGGSNLTMVDTDGDGLADTADSNGGYLPDTSDEYSVLVTIPGPVSEIEIFHTQDGSGNSGINVTDVYFDVPGVTPSEGAGDDTLSGGAGDDLVYGEGGDDSLKGGSGDDTLEGGQGSDTIKGNADDDLIRGGAGDSIIGGGDSDTIIIDQDEVDSFGNNDAAIFADGSGSGDDRDTLDLTDFVSYRNLVETVDGDGDSTSGSVQVKNDDGEWVDVTFAEIETLLLPPKEPDGIVDGEEFGEVMELGYDDANAPTDGGGDLITTGDDSIEGNGGDDSIQADDGNDSVDGGTGNDTVRGNDGDDSLLGGDGEDSISGGTGNDTIDGGDDDDTITGGSGDDVIDGGQGNDTVTGGTGADSITDLDGDNEINSDNPGSFNPDLGTPIGSPNSGFVVVAPDTDPDDNKDTVTTGDGNDTIRSGDDADLINAGNGDNVVDAGTDADTVTTGDGDDSITGGEGSDLINSGDGNDTIDGGVGNPAANLIDDPNDGFFGDPILDNGDDTINAGAGNDVVDGEDDNDLIDGGDGDDTLDGGIDDDTVLGGDGDDVIIGGQGADSLDGGEGDDVFNVGTFTDVNGTGDYQEGIGDTIVGGEDPDDGDIDTLDLTGSGSLKVIYDDSIDPGGTPGESGTVIFYTDNTQTEESGRLTFKEIENVVPCFTPGALIATPKGEVPVETLRVGDKVITRDNGIQEIRWTGKRTLNRMELADHLNMKPVFIKAGALGHNLPERDMLVSPQHRMLLTGETPQLYFEESEVLVAAKHLVGRQGIGIMDTLRTTYIHFMFDRHEVVLADGAWTESFQPGDQSLGSMGQETRDEIFALFPDLATQDGLTDYAAARRSLKAHEAKLLQL